jgi:hypothetical protein
MFDKMKIFVPSYKRGNNVKTIYSLSKNLLKNTSLVVYPEEFEEYKKSCGSMCEVVSCPLRIGERGLANKKQWILDAYDVPYHFYFDDDLEFGVRGKDGKLRKASFEDVDDMVKLLFDWLCDGISQVGMSSRANNYTVKREFVEVSWMSTAYGFDTRILKKYGITWNRLNVRHNVMEDADLILTMLEKGEKNRVSYKYFYNQIPGSEGGCATYRDNRAMRECALEMKRLHPYSVGVVRKLKKRKWAGFDSNLIYDIRKYWKKAYNSKKKFGF